MATTAPALAVIVIRVVRPTDESRSSSSEMTKKNCEKPTVAHTEPLIQQDCPWVGREGYDS
jgi:hypothetical protein